MGAYMRVNRRTHKQNLHVCARTSAYTQFAAQTSNSLEHTPPQNPPRQSSSAMLKLDVDTGFRRRRGEGGPPLVDDGVVEEPVLLDALIVFDDAPLIVFDDIPLIVLDDPLLGRPFLDEGEDARRHDLGVGVGARPPSSSSSSSDSEIAGPWRASETASPCRALLGACGRKAREGRARAPEMGTASGVGYALREVYAPVTG